jgi:hypothetical protein
VRRALQALAAQAAEKPASAVNLLQHDSQQCRKLYRLAMLFGMPRLAYRNLGDWAPSLPFFANTFSRLGKLATPVCYSSPCKHTMNQKKKKKGKKEKVRNENITRGRDQISIIFVNIF